MPRPCKPDRPVKLRISLPQSIHDRLSALLFSTAEGTVPRGAWSDFFTSLAEQALSRIQEPKS